MHRGREGGGGRERETICIEKEREREIVAELLNPGSDLLTELNLNAY